MNLAHQVQQSERYKIYHKREDKMKPIYVEIERLMKLANERNIALECTKMEAEENIEKVTFYANNEKISYSDLLEKLQ